MKIRLIASSALLVAMAACTGAKDTQLPTEVGKMDSIKPQVEKLKPEERDLLAGYVLRHTVAAALRGEKDGIPAGTTLGKAIDEQREFLSNQKIEEAKQAALKAELQAKRDAAIKQMRDAVTVTLVDKKIEPEYGFSGMLMDENLEIRIGYHNNTAKDIAGVKGMLTVNDLFGDKLSAFAISNDDTIPAGGSIEWQGTRSVKYAGGSDNKDRKLAALDDSKYTVVWEPSQIVFADGAKLEQPED
ncbi:hypothetical protein [Pseudoxanthomonas sp. USHLN014]|uniref:hypothetical protein n=1 Tax=Pseudoxanthomonas sp. USHLN014 TaxID=3081297 RepID=UPI00301E52B5